VVRPSLSSWRRTASHCKSIYLFLCFFLAPTVWRIRDVYPGSRILIFTRPGSRIPDLKTAKKREGWKKFVITFYVATNFTKFHIILVLMCWRKKFGPIFKEL
jgi:hypothetical protein